MSSQEIIILHGWGANKSRFIKLQEQLLESGIYSKIPDLPGFGESTQLKYPWNIDNYVAWLDIYIGNRREVILVGYSFGGQIAVAYSLKYPQKIAKIILVAPAAIRKTTSQLSPKYLITKIGKFVFNLPILNIFDQLIRKYWYKLVGNPDYYIASPIMRQTMQKIITADLSNRLSEIQKPVLLLWGSNDKSTPFIQAQIYLNNMSNCRLVEYPNADHYFIYNQTEKVIDDIMKFITE